MVRELDSIVKPPKVVDPVSALESWVLVVEVLTDSLVGVT